MAGTDGPGESGKTGSGKTGSIDRDGDLESRRQQLGATIAARQAVTKVAKDGPDSSGKTGIGAALKLSSEFIAGILVGVGLGWMIDYWAGTSPWGLIIFLFLGFGAGVLNVMRSVGVVAEAGIRRPDGNGDQSAGT
ncbi:MAG: AtpZ/AtpI family protein [Rhizobiaceae bacterium]